MPPPFRLDDPPDDPPPYVPQPRLWRLAAYVFHSHHPVGRWPACRRCGEAWPCAGRQLAERVLVTVLVAAGPSYLDVLRGEDGHS